MVIHSSVLACRIPWTEETDGLQSMRSQRVGHDWVANTFTFQFFHYFLKRNLTVCPNFHSGSGAKLAPGSRYKGTMEDRISRSACAVPLLPWQSPHRIRRLRILEWSGPLPTPRHIFSSSFPDLPSLCPHTNDARWVFCKCALSIFSVPIKK